MKIHKGDQVKIISGNDKGKQGKVLYVLPQLKKIVVEGLNLKKKHTRPRQQGKKGEVVSIPAPFFASSAMLVCRKCGKATRIINQSSPGKKIRVCRKCGAEI